MSKSKGYFLGAIAFGLLVGIFIANRRTQENTPPRVAQVQALQPLGESPKSPDSQRSLGRILDELLTLRESNNTGKKIQLLSSLTEGLDEEQREALL